MFVLTTIFGIIALILLVTGYSIKSKHPINGKNCIIAGWVFFVLFFCISLTGL